MALSPVAGPPQAAFRTMPVPDLANPAFKANPWSFYTRLRAEAPVLRARIAGRSAWLVSRYDDVVDLLKDERLSNDWTARMPKVFLRFAGPLVRNMLNSDPPDHTRLRALVQKAFTPRLVETMRDRIQRVCDDLLDAVPREGRVDLVEAFALPLPLTVISDLLGIPGRDRLRFHSWSKHVVGGFGTLRALPRVVPSMWLVKRYLRRLVAHHREDPREDMVTELIRAEQEGDRLGPEELIAMIGGLLVAGYETTVSLIASGALALMQDPRQRDLWLRNPGLAEPAIEELLRFVSPLDMASPRIPREEHVIGSVRIPAGEPVIALLGSANHDESQFSNPDSLDLTRTPSKHVAFGLGVHFCLGASLARLEGIIALTTLMSRFPGMRLADHPERPRWRRSLILRGLESLPVTV